MGRPTEKPQKSSGYRLMWAVIWGLATWVVGGIILVTLWDSVLHGDPSQTGLGFIAAVAGVVVAVYLYKRL